MIKLALMGKMACGKSTLSAKFQEFYNAKRVSLADPLKEEVLRLQLTPDGKIDKARDRGLLQDYAQLRRGEKSKIFYYAGRVIIIKELAYLDPNHLDAILLGRCYSDFWVDMAKDKLNQIIHMDKFLRQGSSVVVDDIRRLNELEMFKSQGFIIVKVEADDSLRLQRLIDRDGGFDASRLNDISESEIDSLPCDFSINNNGFIKESWEELVENLAIFS